MTPSAPSRWSRPPRPGFRTLLFAALAIYPAFLAAFSMLDVAWPQRSGILGLVAIAMPVALVGVIVFVPFALLRGSAILRVALAIALVVWVARFGGDWGVVRGANAASGVTIPVMTWNLEVHSRPPATMVAEIRTAQVKLIALQEVDRPTAAAIGADPDLRARFPYRVLDAYDLGILSAYPISNVVRIDDPFTLIVDLNVAGRPLTVITAHPYPGIIQTIQPWHLPVGYDPARRDAAIERLHARIAAQLARGRPVLVLGDFNTAPTEPANGTLTNGLLDVHDAVGEGPGWTWRPQRLEFLHLGFVRIDRVLAGPGVSPLSQAVDCSISGDDHCRLFATVAIV